MEKHPSCFRIPLHSVKYSCTLASFINVILTILLYHEKPSDFPLDMRVSEGIIEHDWKILLVQRSQHCSSPNTWSGPGWKLDPGEDNEMALIRELIEEIWIDVSTYPKKILFQKYFYFLEKNIEIHFYKIHCAHKPKIILNNEHQAYAWVRPIEALEMHLTEDFDAILQEIYSL